MRSNRAAFPCYTISDPRWSKTLGGKASENKLSFDLAHPLRYGTLVWRLACRWQCQHWEDRCDFASACGTLTHWYS